ncbi:MAG: TonB-dependent receptor [Bacteroidetes bacterium]|nr:TonB-dependent receptor [Bacteroidota bacterium]
MRKLLLSLTLLFTSYLLFAQQTVTIKVKDSKTGEPVTSASVVIRSTSKGASTNNDGVFTIQAKAGDVLDITCVGYKPNMLKLNGATEYTVQLEMASLELGDVVVIGTRGAARAKTETAVPVDVIKINQVGEPTAKMDLTSILNMTAPSFNYNKQSGADGADHIDLGTLRGLGPDQTLVLINGKRRHATAFVALFGTRGRGASGTDMNAFPESIVDRIEILRDGASAQYGSDAMAGVMNIILKKDVNHWTISTGWAGYYDNKFNASKFNAGNQYYSGNKIDGGTYTLSVNNGFTLGKSGGFINMSFDYLRQGKTYREVDTTNWQTDKNALPYINSGRRAFGDGSVNTYGSMYNMELPIKGTHTTFYSFGGVNSKASDAYAYTRNLSAKPKRFPTTASGSPIYVPEIMRISNDGETYYNPHIGTNINDASIAFGFRGKSVRNWNWDLSFTDGKNNFQYFGDKTFNASLLGNTTKTYFDDGGFRFRQATINLDFSKPFASVLHGLNIGYGAEYRNEKYTINKGEEASYAGYANNYDLAPGSQGFPGFSPLDTVTATRYSFSAYGDAELNVTDKWLVDGATRLETYSDFGSVATFKFATRYKAADNFNLRGSVSTGFRAPSLAQIYFSNTLTSFSNGQLVQSRIIRNTDPIAKAVGIPELKQETSLNASAGFAWKVMPGFTITLDGYMVKVKDRVVLSGLFSQGDPSLPQTFNDQLASLGVATAQFFTNAVNTTNTGLDVVADYTKKWNGHAFKAILAGNFQNIKLDKINVPAALSTTTLNKNTFYSDREIAFLKASAPKEKFNLNLEYDLHKFGFGTHLTYYGDVKLLGFGDMTPDNPYNAGINPQVPSDANGTYVPEVFDYKGKLVTDVFASYKFCNQASIFIGADNLLNVHPNLGVNPLAKGWAGDNESGGPWDSVQMGFNGRKIFAKLVLNF